MKEEIFEPIIGLEIHVELKTKSKMFCGCRADWFGQPPNSLTCPVCLGLPGALPVPNRRAVEWCVMLGRALNCHIPAHSKFDRKNYFYPDLPKGYQISQYDQPLAINGSLKFNVQNPKSKVEEEKTVRIRRVHMEEDTGKLIHATVDGKKCTLVDFNRSGVPLVEIVTEPDIRSSEEAKVFLKRLHRIIRYLDISDADMEKGSMRLEPNISVRVRTKNEEPRTRNQELQDLPSYKVEVKNINSFNFVKKAIDYEVARHSTLLLQEKIPVQETRGWDEKRGVTVSQRSKEEAHDYRYFPDPDIPPIVWTKSEIDKIGTLISELPETKKSRYVNTFGLSSYDASILTDEKNTALYFEKAVEIGVRGQGSVTVKEIANWIINKKIDVTSVSAEELVAMISRRKTMTVLSDAQLEPIIREIVKNNQKAANDYRSGKENALMFLLGHVMRATKGKAEAGKVKELLLSELRSTK